MPKYIVTGREYKTVEAIIEADNVEDAQMMADLMNEYNSEWEEIACFFEIEDIELFE
jgi:hypothetical protein